VSTLIGFFLVVIVMVEYILGTLVHSFDWKLPNGVELNMDESYGLALQKWVPLRLWLPHGYL
jgi:hypothetical protein